MTMKPDRSNYEIWLIDWLDGNLDRGQTELLMSFLDENPDLKEEADSLAITRVLPKKEKPFQKDQIKKTITDLSLSQIEYLSVAYLENDLSTAQVKELEENLSQNAENKRIFDMIQRARLKPPAVTFGFKNRLIRVSREKRILRLMVTGLSAAAAVAILIISFIALPVLLEKNNEEIAFAPAADTILLQPGAVIVAPVNIAAEVQQPANEVFIADRSEIAVLEPVENAIFISDYVPVDSATIPVRATEYLTARTPDLLMVKITTAQPYASLVSSNITVREYPVYDDRRGRIRRFIASTFREKLLKVEDFNDSPLKTYEIAEAGIDGLNKLLGWEMSLVKTTGEEGEMKSFYFSSRVLKFNAPVKKPETSL